MSRLLLGTSNPAKLAQLRALVDGLDVQVLAPSDVGGLPPLEEGDTSLQANAASKATAWARAAGMPTLASDGGLEVPALGTRWNATRTHRAAGMGATDAERAAHLLRLARALPRQSRVAYQVEVVALADATGQLLGTWEGRSDPLELAASYDDTDLPPGFWVPGVLLYSDQRYASACQRGLTDLHWQRLEAPVRQAVTRC